MAITVLLELRLKVDALSAASDVVARALEITRNFAGNLGVDVLVDSTDNTRWVIIEHWADVSSDEAYRAFRAGAGRNSELFEMMAEPPLKTRYNAVDI